MNELFGNGGGSGGMSVGPTDNAVEGDTAVTIQYFLKPGKTITDHCAHSEMSEITLKSGPTQLGDVKI